MADAVTRLLQSFTVQQRMELFKQFAAANPGTPASGVTNWLASAPVLTGPTASLQNAVNRASMSLGAYQHSQLPPNAGPQLNPSWMGPNAGPQPWNGPPGSHPGIYTHPQPDPQEMGPQAPSRWQRWSSNFQSWSNNWGNRSKEAQENAQPTTDAISRAGQIAQQAGLDSGGQLTNIGMKAARAAAGDPQAMAELAAMKAKQNLSDMSEFGDVFKERSALKGGAHAARGMAGVSSTFGGPMGDVMAVPFKFTATLAESVERLRGWNNELHQSNMRFAEYSASMTNVQVQQQIRDMQLSREKGESLADSAQYNAEAKSRLDRALMPLENAFDRLKNNIGGALADATASMIDVATKWLKDEDTSGIVGGDKWSAMVGEEYISWIATKDRPKRFMDYKPPKRD